MQIRDITTYSLQEGCALHRHRSEYEFNLFYVGKGTYYHQNQTVPFSGQVLFLTPPGTSHRVVVDADCRLLRTFSLILSWPDGPSDLKKRVRQLAIPGLPVKDNTALTVFDGISRRFTTRDPFLVRSAENQLRSFLFDLTADRSMQTPVSDNHHVAEAVRILRNSPYEKMTAGILAQRTGLHKAYLIRLFKKHMGTTPMRYLTNVRIEGTAWQLQHTEKPVHRIAEEFLFYDEFHFSRVFKERMGMSPIQYRNTGSK